MTARPRRISMGCYAVFANGRQIILKRCGRSGFRIVQKPGAISPLFRRLRDAARIAMEASQPWPFTVKMKVDLELDQPRYLDRRPAHEARRC